MYTSYIRYPASSRPPPFFSYGSPHLPLHLVTHNAISHAPANAYGHNHIPHIIQKHQIARMQRNNRVTNGFMPPSVSIAFLPSPARIAYLPPQHIPTIPILRCGAVRLSLPRNSLQSLSDGPGLSLPFYITKLGILACNSVYFPSVDCLDSSTGTTMSASLRPHWSPLKKSGR